jgi:hypothetical protein
MTNRFVLSLVLSVLSIACSETAKEKTLGELASTLRDSLGASAEASPAYLRDSTHLQIDLSASHYSSLGDSELTDKARDVAALAMRAYPKRAEVESVTVQGREKVSKGVWRVHWRRTFSSGELLTAEPLLPQPGH